MTEDNGQARWSKVPGYWARVREYLTDPIMPVQGVEWLWELPRALYVAATNRRDYVEWNKLMKAVEEAQREEEGK